MELNPPSQKKKKKIDILYNFFTKHIKFPDTRRRNRLFGLISIANKRNNEYIFLFEKSVVI